MAEWYKILISAVVGMAVGLVSDPLRQVLSRRIDRIRIHRGLRDELRALYLTFYDDACHHDLGREGIMLGFQRYHTGRFRYYYEHRRDACYSVYNWMFIEGFFFDYEEIRAQALRGELPPELAAKYVRRAFFEVRLVCDMFADVEKHFADHGIPPMEEKDSTLPQDEAGGYRYPYRYYDWRVDSPPRRTGKLFNPHGKGASDV